MTILMFDVRVENKQYVDGVPQFTPTLQCHNGFILPVFRRPVTGKLTLERQKHAGEHSPEYCQRFIDSETTRLSRRTAT